MITIKDTEDSFVFSYRISARHLTWYS